MLEKPKIGESCNGCGICCQITVCSNGSYIQGLVSKLGERVNGPCPALVSKEDGTFACGIVLDPKKYIKKRKYSADVLSRNFSILIGSGVGCDELLEHDTSEEEENLLKLVNEMMSDKEWKRRGQIALKVIYGL